MSKRIFMLCLVMCALLGIGFAYAAEDTPHAIERSDIGIYINGVYQTDEAAHGVIVGSRTLVPLRFISEAFGAEVLWDGEKGAVTVRPSLNKSYTLTIDSKTVSIKEGYLIFDEELDICPMLIEESTYVPVRYVSESLQKIVDWDEKRGAVMICEAPSVSCGGYVLDFTRGADACGAPDESFDSCKGFEWKVYNKNTADLMLLGEKNGVITEFFSISDDIQFNETLLSAKNKDEADKISNNLTEIFYDDIGRRFGGIYFSVLGSGNRICDPVKTEEQIAASERRIIELVTNALRVKYGAEPILKYDASAECAAQKHCEDMRQNYYFNHIALDGSRPYERYEREADGVKPVKVGENIAINKNAFSACFAWLNSAPHRECMFDTDYKYIGAGADCSDRENIGSYYGQIYIKK